MGGIGKGIGIGNDGEKLFKFTSTRVGIRKLDRLNPSTKYVYPAKKPERPGIKLFMPSESSNWEANR